MLNYSDLFDLSDFPFKNIVEREDFWNSIFDIEDFIAAFKSDLPREYEEIKDNVIIGKNVDIDKSAKITGPCLIGKNSSVENANYLRGGVIIGEGVHMGHAVEIKHSIVMNKTAIAHLNYIGDSIIGNNVNVSGGSILANWRFDKKDIRIKLDKDQIDSKSEKFGSIVGDNCNIGVNSVLNPGSVLGKDCVVYPLTSVVGFHPAGSKIKF